MLLVFLGLFIGLSHSWAFQHIHTLRHRYHHPQQHNKAPPAQWFDQELDHFNAQDQRMWKQRYFVNDTFF